MKSITTVYKFLSNLLLIIAILITSFLLFGDYFARSALSVSEGLAIVLAGTCAWGKSRDCLNNLYNKHPWRLIACSFFCLAFGTLYIYIFFTAQGKSTPFPCFADIPLVYGSLCFSAGLIWLTLSFMKSGLPLGSKGYIISLAVIFFIAVIVSSLLILSRLLAKQSSFITSFITSSYTCTSLLNLALGLALFLIFLKFRGGHLQRSWSLISTGLLLIFMGNIIFNCKHNFKLAVELIKLNDVIFLLGYTHFFRGVALLRQPRRKTV